VRNHTFYVDKMCNTPYFPIFAPINGFVATHFYDYLCHSKAAPVQAHKHVTLRILSN